MATAYAALVSLSNDLELIKNHPRHSFSFDNNQIESLLERVCFLMDFMETCDYHGAAETEALEKKIAVAAHAAEDVILSHVADQIHGGSTIRDETRHQSCFLLDLQKAIDDMDLQEVQSTLSSSLSAAAAAAAAPITSQKNTMVGFDEVMLQLLDLLTGEASERVIPIVAMGGAVRILTTKRVVFDLGVDDEKQQKALDAVSFVAGVETTNLFMRAKKLAVFGEVDTKEIVEIMKKACDDEMVVAGLAKEFSMWRGLVPSFRFPDSLKGLSLYKSRLNWEELSMMAGSLPLLESIYLRSDAVIGSEWNTIEGHFDHLKSLTIHDCKDLVNFNVDSSHFPALRELVLQRLPILDELPLTIGELPSLELISLSDCNVSLAMSAMRILVDQEQEYGNEGLQLQVDFTPYKPEKKISFKEKMQEEGLDTNNLSLLY